jgi:hypothetical protein
LDNNFNNSGSFVFENLSISDIKKQSSNQFIVGGGGLVRLNIPYETSVKLNEISSLLLISPNPVINELRIEGGELRINGVEIVDLSGKTIYKFRGTRNLINVSTLSQGIYVVKIETDKGIVTKKIVKK